MLCLHLVFCHVAHVWSLDPTFRPKRLLVAELKLEAKFPEKTGNLKPTALDLGVSPQNLGPKKVFRREWHRSTGCFIASTGLEGLWRCLEVAAAPVYRFIIFPLTVDVVHVYLPGWFAIPCMAISSIVQRFIPMVKGTSWGLPWNSKPTSHLTKMTVSWFAVE